MDIIYIYIYDPLPQLDNRKDGNIFLIKDFLISNLTTHELRSLMGYRDITTADGTPIIRQS